MRKKRTPFTISVSAEVQKPPSASTPLQPTGFDISRNGSLNTIWDTPSHCRGAGAMLPPRASTIEAPVTLVQAANAPSSAANDASGPSPASPAGSTP